MNNSESKLIFVENLEQYNKISDTINECPKLNTVVLMDDPYNGNNDNVINLTITINSACYRRTGPGGGTRRLHQKPKGAK